MSRILIIPVLCAAILALSASVALADCPNCYRDQTAMTSSQTGTGGRPIITLQIAGDWDTSPGSGTTRTNIHNAVQSAVANWNGATGSNGSAAPYIIRTGADVQNQPRGSAHVTVVMDPNIRVPTIAGPPGGPYQIKLPQGKKDCSVESLIATFEHELAHIFGLDHPSDSTGNIPPTSSCVSVARAPADGSKCNPPVPSRAIQAADVDKIRGVASGEAFRNANCTIYFKTVPRNEEEPGPGPGPGPGYTDPNPYPYYPPTCYYYYYAEDAYTCSTVVYDDGERVTSCSYQGTRYYLEDVICF
jgi:hypothetical protein